MSFLHIRGYSVDVAKTFGIMSAIFLSCINDKIFYDATDCSTTKTALTRCDIYNMTGMSDSTQVDVESSLSSAGVLSVQPFKNVKGKSYYAINYKKMYEIMNTPKLSDVLVEDKVVQAKKTVNTRANQIKTLKGKCVVDDEAERQLLCDWIDSVYANPKGFISPQSVKITIESLSKFTIDDRVSILKIAIANSWKDISWAVDRFNKQSAKRDDYRFCDYESIKYDGTEISKEEF